MTVTHEGPPMRIVYLHQYYCTPDEPGGIRSYEFARRMVARGHSVDVVTSCPVDGSGVARGQWTVRTEGGVRVHRCALDYDNTMSYPQRIRAFGEFAVRAALRARSLPRDLVFATSTPLTIALPAVVSSRRVPMVFEVRDVWPELPIALGALRRPWTRRLAYALESWAYRHAEHVVALSPDMAASIRRRHPHVAVTVVPNSSDTEMFDVPEDAGVPARACRPWLGDRPLVLYAGTFGLANGLGYLVRAAAAARTTAPGLRFLLVGEGREAAEVESLARELGVLGENLVIEPPMPKRDLPALLAAADVCVSAFIDVPELAGNSANKAFDTFAAGRPLLVNHGGWLADLLQRTGAGLVARADDPADAVEVIQALLADPDRTARARRASRALAASTFSRDVLFERLMAVLEQVAARGVVTPLPDLVDLPAEPVPAGSDRSEASS